MSPAPLLSVQDLKVHFDISRKGLQNKMKELGLRDPENKA